MSNYDFGFVDPQAEQFIVRSDFPQLPKELTSAIINLFLDYTKQGTEVSVFLLLDRTETNWRAIVGKQSVSKVHVKASPNIGIDLVSGKLRKPVMSYDYPLIGSMHSHNTMNAFFSGLDDIGELHTDGLHIVIGSLHFESPQILTSFVQDGKRYIVDSSLVAEDWSYLDVSYHENVHRVINIEVPDILYQDDEFEIEEMTSEEISMQEAMAKLFW